jgi:hypothetical protein
MKVKQNRPQPAFQEYAANMLANATFRGASLKAKGLLFQLRLECWANVGQVPTDQTILSKFLGIPLADLQSAFAEVSEFFRADGEILRCPELDAYRAYCDEVTRLKSEGGKEGAAKTNAGKLRVSRNTLDQTNLVKPRSDQNNSVIKEEDLSEHAEWIKDYDAH